MTLFLLSLVLLWGQGHMNVPDETSSEGLGSPISSQTCTRPELPVKKLQKLQPLYSVPSVSLLCSLCLAVLKSFTVLSDKDLMLFFKFTTY